MTTEPYFGPELFAYLRALGKNNNREWFQANKKRFERDVRDPMLRFISDFGSHLDQISPRFVADPRPSGGSLFRIYRDVRFSKDKRPYKTNIGAHFRHQVGKDAHAPGFYLHLEAGEVFGGSGIWHPDAPALAKIRDAIVEDPKGWRRATSAKVLGAGVSLSGESLKRAPQGYDPDHPLIEDLKHKDFFVGSRFDEDQACEPEFIKTFAGTCKRFTPLTRFLTKALDLPW